MDLVHLRAFVVVAEERHFGRAALRLELSQPQVSRQVRALEDELGVALFERTARQTQLTEAGALLLPDARETLAAAQRLDQRANAACRGLGGRVAVAFVWSTLRYYLPQLVAAAAERLPHTELAVSQLTFLELVPAMRRGDVDVAIARPLWRETDMSVRTLRMEPSMLAIPAGHPLATRTTVPLRALSGEPMIALHRAFLPEAYDGQIARAGARGLVPDIVQHARSQSEALALVSAGIGIYRLPSSATMPLPGVVYRELEDTPSRVTLLHRPLVSPPVERVIELAVELFGDAPDDAHDASNNAPTTLDQTPLVA